jgi:hypothetical protein
MSNFPSDVRDEVLAAINKENGYYYHQKIDGDQPYCYNGGFIDGLSWMSRCWGACLLVGDIEIASLCEKFCKTILTVGADARNYAPLQADTDWVASTKIPGMWYVAKENYFDGPGALQWAIKCGAKIDNPLKVQIIPGIRVSVMTAARWQIKLGRLFGWWYKKTHTWTPAIIGDRQIEPVWMSYLLLGEKVPDSMLWMCEENPWYSFIAGKKCDVSYPLTRQFMNSTSLMKSNVVPLQRTKPNAWIFKRSPFSEYSDGGGGQLSDVSYTPVWKLVADYCQSTLV